MDVFQAAVARRSVRSFRQAPIDKDILEQMVDAARLGPSGANRQPLSYIAVTEKETCAKIFDCLKWAAYTTPRGTPAPGHTPTGYLIVAVNKDLCIDAVVKYDVGAAIQTLLLMGVENGLGSCWLRSVNLPEVAKIIGLPENVAVDSVVALGYPDEQPKLVNLADDQVGVEVIKYWRDEDEQHFVPKRSLKNVLHWEKFGG